jgi:3-phosphoshikimate 1-carboxyvinyltransferase
MNERPKKALFQALRELGYRVDSPTDKLPAVIHGSGPKPGAKCRVDIEESSQFASALLLCAKVGGWNVDVVGENAEESPYVAMTSKLIEEFRRRSGKFGIEPDASSASYFWAVGALLPASPEWKANDESTGIYKYDTDFLPTVKEQAERFRIKINHFPTSEKQIDSEFPRFLPPPIEVSRSTHLGDSIMTGIVIAPLFERETRFIDLGRLRVQECERVVALRTELTKCGAKVIEKDDTLEVYPSKLHGAEIETYNDHRMAMCFAILGLKVPGIKLKNPSCVKKTFPNFFQKLAAAPPHGLGVTILDAKTGRKLAHDELFAD